MFGPLVVMVVIVSLRVSDITRERRFALETPLRLPDTDPRRSYGVRDSRRESAVAQACNVKQSSACLARLLNSIDAASMLTSLARSIGGCKRRLLRDRRRGM
jgi:hypothetical protein